MKKQILVLLAVIFCFSTIARAEMIYISGHADLGVGFENNNLHLHLHAEGVLGLFGGGTTAAGEYDPGDLIIGVPGPSISRPSGAQWNFLASSAGNPIWLLPQSSDPAKPFLGLGTEELLPANGWTTPLTWTFNSISTINGNSSQFSLWQNDAFGSPTVFASTLVPTGTGNSWTQNPFSHDHFNIGFTQEGVYDVNFTITGTNATLNQSFNDTASFRFATGSAISAVPEPSSMAFFGIATAGLTFFRMRRAKTLRRN